MGAPAAIAGAICLLIFSTLTARAGGAPRALSLDQCADQYLLALSPRAAIVGVSPRAGNGDSYLAERAKGLPIRRADLESVLASHPQVVVRYWGGDPGLLTALKRRGIAVAEISDAVDFAGVRRSVRAIAKTLGQTTAGEALIARMDDQLARSRDAWRGRNALYLTSGGATAGRGTLIDAILSAAGLHNLADGQGFRALSLEQLTLHPPQAVIEGFFDDQSENRTRWSPGRHDAMTRLMARRTLVSLPGSMLGCPAWFVGDAVARIAAAAPARAAGG